MKRAITLLTGLSLSAAPAAALAQAPPDLPPRAMLSVGAAPAAPAPAPEPDQAAAPLSATRPGEVTLAAGMRGMVVPGAGLDPYASGSDFLMMSSISAGATLLRAGRASVVASVEWNMGSRTDSARGQEASLTLHRLAGGVETRFQPARRLYLFAKLAPAALKLLGSIQAPSLDRPLVARPWTWSLDATGGAGLLMGTAGSYAAPAARFWLTGELGYSFAGSATMSYAPASSDTDPRQYGTLMLPALKPAGGVARLAVAVAF